MWSPSNISPSGWIDASDASSYNLNSGADLSSITDKSGNFSMTIDGTPTRYLNRLNGLSTIYFDGDESLISSDQDQVASNGNHWAIGVFNGMQSLTLKILFGVLIIQIRTVVLMQLAAVQLELLGLVKLITMVITLLYQGLLKILLQ